MNSCRGLTLLWAGLFVLALVTSQRAEAAWPHESGINLPVCADPSSQTNPAIASDGAGGAIVTWYDYRNGTTGDIYAQRVSSAGVVQWATDGVAICTDGSSQLNPRITSDGAGGAIVAWEDIRNGYSKIYAQRVSSDGVVQWAIDGVDLCTGSGAKYKPMITSDGAGGAIVTWYDYRNGNSDIYAQLISSAGVIEWATDGVALCSDVGNQYYPTIASDGAGGAIVTWYDNRGTYSDIYAQRVSSEGVVQWTADGVALCTAYSNQIYPVIIPDGTGGAIVTWEDSRNTGPDIYAQRISAGGIAQWTADGVALCTASGNQYYPEITSDGEGGAIVAWYDDRNANYDIYVQRVTAAGAVPWTTDGVALCTDSGSQSYPVITTDGAGGAIAAWQDHRNGNDDVYAQRISSAGVVQWTVDGTALGSAPKNQTFPVIASDDAGGAIVTWNDYRNPSQDIYAQRVGRFGYLGTPEPTITGVDDVPNDQGGQVKLSWDASYLDMGMDPNLSTYDILRSVPPNQAQEAVAAGARLVTDPAAMDAEKTKTYLVTQSASATYYWEFLTSIMPLHYVSGYSYLAPTTGDSLATGNPLTAFMVVGHDWANSFYWMSRPATGYSVDNLAPGTPVYLTSGWSTTGTQVRWQPNPEVDLAQYRLYRGADAGFVPGPGNLVVAQADTGYVDTGSSVWSYYKLTAVDVHGNESIAALLSPQQVSAVPGGQAPPATRLLAASPNPFNPRTTIGFDLARTGPVRMTVYNLNGQVVRTLIDGVTVAGHHEVTWSGTSDRGLPQASGIYLVRLVADSRVATERMTLIK